MKNIYIAFVCFALVLFNPGCSDILDEYTKSILTPEFFETAQGIEGGVNAAYTYLRYFYGPQGPSYLTVFGTDEFTTANQNQGHELNTYIGISAAQGDVTGPWNRAYPAINTCNGVIELGPTAEGITDELKANLIAEAKFLRAQWYFLLAQLYGGASLDLGSGPLAFNSKPSNQLSRATFIETIDAVIQDATEAAAELPDAPRETGRVWRASAYHLLAKAQLTKAWDTGSAVDFQAALDAVQALIPNASSPVANFGASLQSDYEAVHREGNEYNSEILHSVNRNSDVDFNEYTSGDHENRVNFFFRGFYYDEGGLIRDVQNGRPWIRFQPTEYLLTQAFNNKAVDSRYEKSFQTVWYANDPDYVYPTWSAADVTAGFVNQDGTPAVAGEPKFGIGDTAVWMTPDNINTTGDFEARKGYSVITMDEVFPSAQDRNYPALSKYNTVAREIEGTEEDPNISSVRPIPVYRLAETYLLGAEAAFMLGDDALAAQYINTVRRRAARTAAQQTAMEISAATITAGGIDYILDERTRELAGELMRWFDLTRTNKLVDRLNMPGYTVPATGNVRDYHMLRPIPQGSIDLTIDPTTTDGKYPQNPGY